MNIGINLFLKKPDEERNFKLPNQLEIKLHQGKSYIKINKNKNKNHNLLAQGLHMLDRLLALHSVGGPAHLDEDERQEMRGKNNSHSATKLRSSHEVEFFKFIEHSFWLLEYYMSILS